MKQVLYQLKRDKWQSQDASRHQNTNLEETAAYRAYQAAMDSEEALVFATLDQIKEYVKKLGVKS